MVYMNRVGSDFIRLLALLVSNYTHGINTDVFPTYYQHIDNISQLLLKY